MMTEITFHWIDADGQEMADPPGYNVHDYFSDALEDIEAMAPDIATYALAASYRGADCDGIGLVWDVE